MKSFNVTNYNVQIHTEVNNPVPYNAFIGLNLVETNVSVATNAVAFLNFYETGQSLPDNSVQNQSGMDVYIANFRTFWFATIVDLVRNENPVTFWFDEITKEALLGTGTQEPIGEGE